MSIPQILTQLWGTKFGIDEKDRVLFGADPATIARGTFDVTVTAAQVLALFATQVELVPAPGANRFNVLEWALFFYDYGGTAYGGIAAGEDLVISYTNVAGVAAAEIETTGFLDLTADAYRLAYPHSGAVTVNSSMVPVANAALVLGILIAEVITGNSPLIVKGGYSVVGFTP